MKVKRIIPALVAAALLTAATIGTTMAYFSTYAETEGGKTIVYSHYEQIYEEAKDLAKDVTITAEKDSQAAFIRAKAFTGSEYELSIGGAGWTAGDDDWYYYADPIADGASTSVLHVEIVNIPAEADLGDGLNISVVYESTLALYQKEGDSFKAYADWDKIQSSGSSSTDAENEPEGTEGGEIE